MVSDTSDCASIDSTMHSIEGVKKEATAGLTMICEYNLRIKNGKVGHLPLELQLPRTNLVFRIVVPKGSKFDILRLICTSKPQFGCLVEAFYNVGNGFKKLGVAQKVCKN